jgi:hypothetical protein
VLAWAIYTDWKDDGETLVDKTTSSMPRHTQAFRRMAMKRCFPGSEYSSFLTPSFSMSRDRLGGALPRGTPDVAHASLAPGFHWHVLLCT